MTIVNENDKVKSITKTPSKFNVDIFDVRLHCIELLKNGASKEVNRSTIVNNSFNDIRTKKEVVNVKVKPGYVTLHELLLNSFQELFNKHLLNLDRTVPENLKLYKKYSSVVLRGNKVKTLVLILDQGIKKYCSTNNYINEKMDAIINELYISQIVTDFTTPISKDLTIQSTLIKITILLQKVERQLKDIFPAILSRGLYPLKVDTIKAGLDYMYLSFVLDNFAPDNLQGIEPDYYYILQLYRGNISRTFFNEIQKKQWDSYVADLDIIFLFLSLNHKGISGFVTLRDLIINKTNYINHRYDKFKNFTECSDTLFHNIISALNVWIPLLWFAVYGHLSLLNQPNIEVKSTSSNQPETSDVSNNDKS